MIDFVFTEKIGVPIAPNNFIHHDIDHVLWDSVDGMFAHMELLFAQIFMDMGSQLEDTIENDETGFDQLQHEI